MTYDEKMEAIQAGLEKGLVALEAAEGWLNRAVPLLEGYRDLIRSDYEGRNGISPSMAEEYEKVQVLISDITGIPH